MKWYFVGGFLAMGGVFAFWLWAAPRETLAPRLEAQSRAEVRGIPSPQVPNRSVTARGPAVRDSTSAISSVATLLRPTTPSPEPPTELAAFSRWAEQFVAAPGSVSEARGRALAWTRREMMLRLIQEDRQKALAFSAPFHWRQALPASITQLFEEQIDGIGSLEVAIASAGGHETTTYRQAKLGKRIFQAFVFGRRLADPSRYNIRLHGIAIGGKLALDSNPIRALDRAEAAAREAAAGTAEPRICAVCGQPASGLGAITADTGGELAHYCGVEHQHLVNTHWSELEATLKSGGPALKNGSAWTLGAKTVLYMRVNFPDDLTEPVSQAEGYAAMDTVNDFYTENSYGLTSLTPTVTPLLTLPQQKANYAEAGPFSLLEDARTAARQAGYNTDFFDLDIVCLTSVPGFDWAGLGVVGGKGTWLQSMGAGVTAHELGHNYGLSHANFWDTATNSSSGIGQGRNVEYGNIYDTMGAASAGRNHFNAYFKNQLSWLPSPAVPRVASNTVYRLYSFDLPHRLNGPAYALRVPKDFERDYWIELRQQFSSDPNMGSGVVLNWSPWSGSSGGTDLIDTTPDSPQRDARTDSALVIGRTFSDAAAGFHLTPLGRGVDGTNSWMDVQVFNGRFPENHSPTVQLQADIPNPAAGELVHFQAVARDPDGDTLAYAWWFDQSDFSTNNLPWARRRFSVQGAHTVRCVVSDMKGGTASANAIITIGNAAGHVLAGKIVDTNGAPVEGVRVDNLADTNTTQQLVSYTDSEGTYLIAGVNVDANLVASKYGLVFTNVTWTNPITAGVGMLKADFLATALPVVTISETAESLLENSSGSNKFVLTRAADPATNLIVNVFLTGNATLGRDYRIDPELTNGVNTLEFPPGAEAIEITLRPINDTLAEGPETVTLALVEESAYVIGSLGQATSRILDDDNKGLPMISVAAANRIVLENGMDAGEAVFSRSGSTAADLYVYYDVAGTATEGVDFRTPAGVVLIPAGQSTAAVRFLPLDDKLVEEDETIIVTALPDAAYLADNSSAQLTIADDDELTVTIYPTVSPAREPSSPGRFTIKREGDLTANLRVFYLISGTALSDSDYEPLSVELVIPAGAASGDIIVTPRDDSLLEGDESVTLTLTNTAAYDVGAPGAATVFIVDNEKPTVSIAATDSIAAEPGEDFGTFTISRGNVSSGSLPVYLAISGTAMNGIDYVPLDNVVVIPNGARQVKIDVIPFDDLHMEPAESVQLVVLGSTNYNVGASEANVMIQDDDNGSPAVGFTFSTSSSPESQSPDINLSLSSSSFGPVTVNYRVIGGTATTNDYTLPAGPLTIDAGRTNALLPLTFRANALPQPDRTILIALYDPVGATLDGIKIHKCTIVDDDSAVVSITATAPDAFEEGRIAGNFRLRRVGNTDSNLLVTFQVAGSASAPADYASLGESVVVPAGASFVDLPVFPVDDQAVELEETVEIELIRASGASLISPATATVTLHDHGLPQLPVVTVTSTNTPNAVEGGPAGGFRLTRNNTEGELTVSFSVQGSAIERVDYVAMPRSVTFTDGQSSIIVPVQALDDSTIEGEESVILALTQQKSCSIAYPGSATVLLQDNDQRVWVDASDFIAAEPGSDIGQFTFTREGTTNGDLRVGFRLSGTAVNGVDYFTISNSVVIPAGSASTTLSIRPLDDLLMEGPEVVTLTLDTSATYVLAAPTAATLTINDDEPMLTLTATRPSVVEGSQVPGVLTITRTGDPQYAFMAHVALDGSATFGVDYPAVETNVFFACGITEIDLAIYPVNELTLEGNEVVNATLLPSPDYTILSPSNALVRIEDVGLNHAPEITVERPRSQPAYLRGPTVMLLVRASVSDDSGATALTSAWSLQSGPCPVMFGSSTNPTTTVTFTNAGFYLLRLTADDGQLQTYRDMAVTVVGDGLFQGAILHWTLDEGSGTRASDSSGQERDGVLVGNCRWVNSGVFGGAVEFAGPGDFLRGTGTSNLFNQRREMTVSLWYNAAETNVEQAIFCANTQTTQDTLALYARPVASCGDGTNVYEATLQTTAGSVHYVSSSSAVTPGWHNLCLTWSSGSELVLYIDGHRDRPGTRSAALAGAIANSPEFVIGKGSLSLPFSLSGQVDDVLVFPRAVTETEAGGIGEGTCTGGLCIPGNFGPTVDAGPDLTVQLPVEVQLAGTVIDDGLPQPPATVSNFWELVSGPAPVTLPDPNALTNVLRFPVTGTNIFRLIADDGDIATCDEVTILIIEPTQVDVWASDFDGTELGPDPAEFTISRVGGTDYELTVFLEFGGIATNGIDFERVTNAITFGVGTDTLTLPIVPFLDHRTEGDQELTVTILTNLAYTVGNGQATIIIHDSPYGTWTIDHFTLEELTDPQLSGETGDYDRDRWINFVEYASNTDPKTFTTNAPLVVSLQADPVTRESHAILSFHRRLPPTDVGYAPAVSEDLLTWRTGTNYIEELQVVDDGNALTETVTARVKAPLSPKANQFVTVRVWLETTQP